jgi:hypothetical protein
MSKHIYNDATTKEKGDSEASQIMQLPFSLTWELDQDSLERVEKNYLQLLEETFSAWAEKHNASSKYMERIKSLELYSILSLDNQLDFLSLPAVSATLLQIDQEIDQGDSHSVAGTFLDDLFFESSNSQNRSTTLPSKQLFSVAFPPSRNPKTVNVCHSNIMTRVNSIILDVASPICPLSLASLDIHCKSELDFIIQRLSRVFDMIRSISGNVLKLIESVLKVISIRKDMRDPNGFSSSSWPGLIGTIALTNSHRLDISDKCIADAIIHESIHSLLYMIECFEPFYISTTAASRLKATSPWSGKLLYLHSYIHACFVWFGLWCFWSLVSESEHLPDDQTTFFRDRACRGFIGRDVLTVLDEGQEQITEPIRIAIETMQKIVNCSSIPGFRI